MKTLKDIEFVGEGFVVRSEDLQDMAREWIKKLNKDINETEVGAKGIKMIGQVEWIKMFFNIEDKVQK